MSLIIREASNKDYLGVSNLTKEVHKLHVKNRPDVYRDLDNPLEKDRFDNLLNKSDYKVFIVEDTKNKKLIAYSIVKVMDTQNISIVIPMRIAFLEDFCVKSDYRNQGVGKLLFQYIVDYAKEQGATNIQLGVWEFNKDAIKFYEKMGMSTRDIRMEMKLR